MDWFNTLEALPVDAQGAFMAACRARATRFAEECPSDATAQALHLANNTECPGKVSEWALYAAALARGQEGADAEFAAQQQFVAGHAKSV